ncbi:hypothetical protein MEN41_21885, partial [Dolichospermum sp. ST_con]|nr:hypothetical protein [Dolichospermum sp. ST_con]
MDTTNNNTPTGDNPDNNKTNPNDEEGENCHHKLVWSCDPNSYPRCTAQSHIPPPPVSQSVISD